MFDGQTLVEKIDSDLKYIKNLNAPEYNVFQVQKDTSIYVLKFSPLDKRRGVNHILNEKRALKKAKNINGITHLVKDYGIINNTIAILKEYADGHNLQYIGAIRDGKNLKSQIRKIVYELHNLGMSFIDPSETNIIISHDRSKATLIDLGTCIFKEDSVEKFNAWEKEDISHLSDVFKDYFLKKNQTAKFLYG